MVFTTILAAVAVLAIVSLVINRVNLDEKKRARFLNNFSTYAGVLEYHMEKAFDIIYKDRVFTYSLEATRPREAEIDAISHDFVRLTQKMLGPMMLQELIYLYGSEDALIFNLLNYFNSKYEDDEIRKTSIEELSNTEEE